MNFSLAAKALGGDITGRNQILCPGPGHSKADRSLSVTFDVSAPDGFTVHSFAGDDWRDCKDHVRATLGLDEFPPGKNDHPAVFPMSVQRQDRTAVRRQRLAWQLWREARPIEGTPAETYLSSRGLSYQGEALRWHPSCPFGIGERHGCMVALVRNIVTNEPMAIHRTAIEASGRKIDRKAYGPIGGGAVKLTDDADVTTAISIGEGIETALSIRELPDLANMPVWSVLSAGGIAAFPTLLGIEAVWIAVDNDASGTGQNAARSAGDRLHVAGVETIILASTHAGADLNDRVGRHA